MSLKTMIMLLHIQLIAGDVNKLSTELLKIQNSTRGKPTLYSVKLMEFFFSKNELTDKNSNVLGNKPNGGEKKKGLDSQRLHVIEELIKDSVEGDHEKKKKLNGDHVLMR